MLGADPDVGGEVMVEGKNYKLSAVDVDVDAVQIVVAAWQQVEEWQESRGL